MHLKIGAGVLLASGSIAGVGYLASTVPPDVTSGLVVKKQYTAPWDEHLLIPIWSSTYSCSGSVCSSHSYISAWIPETDHHGPSWVLTLKSCDANKNCRTGEVDVDENVYTKVTPQESYYDSNTYKVW